MKKEKFEQLIAKEPKNDIKKSEFFNEYGEKFTIYNLGGLTIYFEGDETGGEVINLFNENFNIWNKEELKKLAKAILTTLEE